MDRWRTWKQRGLSRRDFLRNSGVAAIGTGVAAVLPNVIWVNEGMAALPFSEGYLLVDTKKCQGCASCMLACSLVHEGCGEHLLARIQVIQDSFERFPNDLTSSSAGSAWTPPVRAPARWPRFEPNRSTAASGWWTGRSASAAGPASTRALQAGAGQCGAGQGLGPGHRVADQEDPGFLGMASVAKELEANGRLGQG